MCQVGGGLGISMHAIAKFAAVMSHGHSTWQCEMAGHDTYVPEAPCAFVVGVLCAGHCHAVCAMSPLVALSVVHAQAVAGKQHAVSSSSLAAQQAAQAVMSRGKGRVGQWR